MTKINRKDYKRLAVCNKSTFSNGEKKLLAGHLSNWSKKYVTDWSDEVYYFVYRQPRQYYFHNIPESIVHNMNKRQKVLWCIKNEEYSIPIPAYGQEILVIVLAKYSNYIRLTILSGDDDIIDLETHTLTIKEIKSFIKTNHKHKDFGIILRNYFINSF